MLATKDLNNIVKFIINTKELCDNMPMQEIERLQQSVETELQLQDVFECLHALKKAYYGEQAPICPVRIYWGAHAIELHDVDPVYIGMMKMLEEYLVYYSY